MKNIDKKLIEAIADDDLDRVNRLISDGANVNIFTEDGFTPLIAATLNLNEKTVSKLIDEGANVNEKSKDKSGYTALHFAAQEGSLEIIKLLVSAGADVNAKDKWGNGVLFRAIGNEELMKYLLENKANPELKNNNGISPLNSLAEGFKYVKKYMGLENEDSKRTNYLSLFEAIRLNDKKTIERLVSEPIDLNVLDAAEEKTALHLAIDLNNNEVVNILIQAGAMIDIRDEYGGTPLTSAAIMGNLEIVKVLVEKGANVNVKDDFGNSILKLAKKHQEIIDYLKSNGAKE